MIPLFAVALAVATVVPTPVDRATPHAVATSNDAAIAARAAAFFGAIQAGSIDRASITSAFSADLTQATLAALAQALAPLGRPSALVLRAKHHVDGVATYDYSATLANGTIAITLGIDEATDLIARFAIHRASAAGS